MWNLWKEPFVILIAFITVEVLRIFLAKEKRDSYKVVIMNILVPSLIVFAFSFLGYQFFK